jgi:hypothetical protein
MAINQVARAKSLAWTAVAGQDPAPPTSPLSNIQSYDTSDNTELVEFLKGTARVATSYQGTRGYEVTVETPDMGTWAAWNVGMRVDNLILTVEGAMDSSGAGQGDDTTLTLSEAVLSAKSGFGHGNEASDPSVGSLTFKLDRHPDSTTDPTVVFAASA